MPKEERALSHLPGVILGAGFAIVGTTIGIVLIPFVPDKKLKIAAVVVPTVAGGILGFKLGYTKPSGTSFQ